MVFGHCIARDVPNAYRAIVAYARRFQRRERAVETMTKSKEQKSESEVLQCGIVMPISATDGCTADHWAEVKSIIVDAVNTIDVPRFNSRLVSDADDVGVIQKRIVQGVYGADVVVCDVSGKNANVMFELGMRLAFDKPTVIIKDDKTDYMFDTGVIEHLTYPRDLRFQRIVEFKQLLAQKVLGTYTASTRDPEHSTFLKNFGTFKVAQLTEKEASAEQVILESIGELQKELRVLRRHIAPQTYLLQAEHPHGENSFTLDEIEAILKQSETLLFQSGPEGIPELMTLRPALRRIRETPSLPTVYVKKADTLLRTLAQQIHFGATNDVPMATQESR